MAHDEQEQQQPEAPEIAAKVETEELNESDLDKVNGGVFTGKPATSKPGVMHTM
jgi:hypothetical protein